MTLLGGREDGQAEGFIPYGSTGGSEIRCFKTVAMLVLLQLHDLIIGPLSVCTARLRRTRAKGDCVKSREPSGTSLNRQTAPVKARHILEAKEDFMPGHAGVGVVQIEYRSDTEDSKFIHFIDFIINPKPNIKY